MRERVVPGIKCCAAPEIFSKIFSAVRRRVKIC